MRGLVSGALALLCFAIALSCGRIGFDLGAESRGVEGGDDGDGGVIDRGDATLSDAALDALSAEAAPDAAVCVGTAPRVSDFCAEVPKLPRFPIIDGLPDCNLTLRPLARVGWTGGTTEPDVAAQLGVAWRPEGLYFYALVTDPSAVAARPADPAESGDGVELYVDADGRYDAAPRYDEPGTRRFVVAAPEDGADVSSRGEVFSGAAAPGAAWTSTRFAAVPRSFGYAVEAFVSAEDLGVAALDLEGGGHVGWNLGINVSYPDATTTGASGHRLGRFFASGDGASPIDDVGALCVPVLVP